MRHADDVLSGLQVRRRKLALRVGIEYQRLRQTSAGDLDASVGNHRAGWILYCSGNRRGMQRCRRRQSEKDERNFQYDGDVPGGRLVRRVAGSETGEQRAMNGLQLIYSGPHSIAGDARCCRRNSCTLGGVSLGVGEGKGINMLQEKEGDYCPTARDSESTSARVAGRVSGHNSPAPFRARLSQFSHSPSVHCCFRQSNSHKPLVCGTSCTI